MSSFMGTLALLDHGYDQPTFSVGSPPSTNGHSVDDFTERPFLEDKKDVFVEIQHKGGYTTDTTTNTNCKIKPKSPKINSEAKIHDLDRLKSRQKAKLGFQGSAIEISTSDGFNFTVKKKGVEGAHNLLLVNLFYAEGDSENGTPRRRRGAGRKRKVIELLHPPTTETQTTTPVEEEAIIPEVITLDDENEDDDIQIIRVIDRRTSSAVPLKPPPPPGNRTLDAHSKLTTASGSVERKRGKQGSFETNCLSRPGKFDLNTFLHTEEDEIMRHVSCFIHHVKTVVMDLKKQRELWISVNKCRVLPTDLPLNTVLDTPVANDEDLITTCGILRRAFLVFYARAEGVYKFVFPHINFGNFALAPLILEMWKECTNQEKEMFYYSNSGLNYDIFNKIAQFPPGIVEQRVLENIFPNGEVVNLTPKYHDLFAVDLLEGEVAEQKRQADDLQALLKSYSLASEPN